MLIFLRRAIGRTDSSSEFARWYRSKTAKDLAVQICTSNNLPSADDAVWEANVEIHING